METAQSQQILAPIAPLQSSPKELATPQAGLQSPKRSVLLLAAGLAVAIAGAGSYLFATRNDVNTDDAQIDADVITVAPRVGGSVVKVDVRDNQKVRAGVVLIEIDPAEYQAREKQAEADLALAQAQAVGAHAQATIVEAQVTGGLSTARAALSGSSVAVSEADSQVVAAQAAIARAEADQRKAQLDFKRAQQLFADKAVAQNQLDAAQAAYDSTNAQLKSAQANLSVARDAKHQAVTRVAEAKGRFETAKPIVAQVAAAQATAAAADARVDSARAALDLAKLQLGYTKVVAAVNGTVSRVKLQPGDLLVADQTVMELVPESIYIEANFKETQIGALKPGQPVTITVDALGRRKFKGKVESLSGGTGARFSLLPPDNASGNFVKVVQRVAVRIAFLELPKDAQLAAGLSADVTVDVTDDVK